MKLKAGWMLTEFSGEYIAVPTGEMTENFHGVVRLNVTGKDIWQGLSDGLNESEIADKLMELYSDLDRETAQKAVRGVVDKLKDGGLLEE